MLVFSCSNLGCSHGVMASLLVLGRVFFVSSGAVIGMFIHLHGW